MEETDNGTGNGGATIISMVEPKYRPSPCVIIDFLPSRFGTGFKASVTLDETTNGISEIAKGLHGFAALPSDRVMKRDYWMPFAVAGLREQGVVFLPPDEIEAYMQRDGAYWAHYGNGSSFPARVPHKQELKYWKREEPRLEFEERYESDLMKAKGSVLPMMRRASETKPSFGKGSIAAALAIGIFGGFYAGLFVFDEPRPVIAKDTVILEPVVPAG